MRRLAFPFIAMLAASTASAQVERGHAAVAADSLPRSVGEAEANGARHPRAIANNPRSPANDSAAVGTHERKCVDVATINVARSGDFIAGPFSYYSKEWSLGFGKIWWQPEAVTTPPSVLVVKAVRLDAEGARVFELTSTAHGISRTGVRSPTEAYPSGIHLPSPGRWMLVAAAGPNWGCFLLSF